MVLKKERKTRAKKGLYVLVIGCLILLCIAIFEGYYSYMLKISPRYSPDTNITFEISKGESLDSIAKRLEQLNLINSPFVFLTYLEREDIDTKIQAGEYVLKGQITIPEIADQLQKSQDKQRTITILEGWSNKDIVDYLEQEGISKEQTQNCFDNCVFNHSFITPKIQKHQYEGFLFPDTYNVAISPTPEKIFTKMLDNFDKKINSIQKDPTENKNDLTIWANNHTLYEIITVASLIEREVRKEKDKKIVSGIIWKRLQKNIGLGIDATYLYMLGDWDAEITTTVLSTDSPYNTRKYTGLPPTPICQPSLASIIAAFNPINTEYLYYLTTPSGEVIYGKTLEEHNRNKRKYLN